MPAASSATIQGSTPRYISWNIALEAPQIARDRRGGLFLHGAVLGHQPKAERRDAGAAAAGTARRGGNHALAIVLVERLDQLPRAAVGHAHRARGSRDR